MEPGESPDDAIKRELLEELRVNVEIVRFAGVYYKMYEQNLNIVFECRITSGTPDADKDEILTYDYFDVGSLPETLAYPSRTVVRHCVTHRLESFVLAFKSPTEKG